MVTPIHVRSFAQVLGVLGAGVAQVVLATVRRPQR
jgi:hypothetical protein